MRQGSCKRRQKFFGIITITDKGQIAIPIELRRDLEIDKGDKLMVIKRTDCKGFNLIKADEINGFIDKLSN